MNRKKIVHIISNFKIGGAQKLLLDLINNSNKSLFDVSVISLYNKTNNSLANEFEKADCPIYYLNKKSGFDINIELQLVNLLRKIRPDVVHTHMAGLKYSIIPLLFCKVKLKCNTEHTIIKENYTNIEAWVKKFAYKYFNVKPVGISNCVSESIKKVYKVSDIKTIYNGINVEKYTHDGERIIDEKNIKLINVATFLPDKNHEFLIESIKILAEKINNFKLYLIGDGKLRNEIQKKIDYYDLGQHVILLGFRNDVNELLVKSDMFLMTSKHEGFGLVLVEAMAAGLPIVATEIGGIPEVVINNQNGLLVSCDKPRLFADAIEKLINEKSKYKTISSNNLLRAKKFDIQNTILEYEKLYLEVE
ncbi:glycosyltransferase [Crassaminicella profunda]|uniref:glycosyltransferase n=1 Tax=Crassaminicella profunda TaxID=1286698 RepID=UPI001CA641DF|nr:glycosyltransferase [Crassaminicella profunda]QZY55557.1 glycosyltransferase [Crassaminicella profunda]